MIKLQVREEQTMKEIEEYNQKIEESLVEHQTQIEKLAAETLEEKVKFKKQSEELVAKTQEKEEKAATRIQAAFRGLKCVCLPYSLQ